MKKIKNKEVKIILLAVISLVIIYLLYSFLIFEIVSLNMHLNIENKVGFNISKDYQEGIYFGTVPLGGSSSKEIFIQNKDYKRTRVVIKSYGNLKNWVSVSDNNFFLKQNESKKIKVQVNVPANVKEEKYRGNLKIIFLRY